MRALFPGYLNREPEEFAAIWDQCIFSFDANFLLDFYRSTPELQKTLFGILKIVTDRSWLTHQAALEYYRNREMVIRESLDSYDKVSALVRDAAKNIENGLKQYQKHTAIEVGRISEIVSKATTDVEALLKELRSKHPNYTKKDVIEEKLAKLFDGKVGAPYSQDLLQTVFQKAAQRYVDRIPPGYKDEQQKEGHRRFGDVVLWFQLLDIAKERKRPVIFVTADSKEDWWTKEGRPRPELIHEMFLDAQVMFHMYKPAQFVTYAGKFLDLKKEAKSFETAATELREIESQRKSSLVASTTFAQLLEAVKPSLAASAAFAQLLDAAKPSPAAFAQMFETIKPNLAASAAFGQLLDAKPNLAESTGFARMLEALKPNPTESAFAQMLEAVKESDANIKSRSERGDSLGKGGHLEDSRDTKPEEEGKDKHGPEGVTPKDD